MARKFDWRSRLHTAIDAVRRKPFAWGENDCALFAGSCVEAVTGTNPSAQYRGAYHDEDGAKTAIAAQGHADLAAAAASLFPEIHVSQARNGDLGAMETPGGWALGVFTGDRIGVLGLKGYATLARGKATRAFRVG